MTAKDFKVSTGLEVDDYVVSPSSAIDGQSLIYDGAAYVPADIVPVGTIEMWAGSSTPPDGWLLCNGQSYSWAQYTRLRDVIGVSYGGTISTSWNVPNFIPSTKPVTPLGVAAGGALGSATILFGSGNTSHTHNLTAQYTSSNTTVQNHNHSANTSNDHSHALFTANWSHNHNTSAPSGTHAHGYVRGNNATTVTGLTAHANHNVSNTSHAHKHNCDAVNLDAHQHSYDTYNVNAHSHNWGTAGIASNAGGSTHDHSINKQSIYFIIKF
jgi:microcystin-dependent protein